MSYTAARMIVKRYEEQGVRGLDMSQHGRPVSSGRSLTAEQEEQMPRLISEKRSEQLKLDFALWTRAAVMLLIEREWHSELACSIASPTTSTSSR